MTNQTDRKLRLSEEIARTTRGSGKPYEIRDRGGKQSQPNLLLRVQPSGAKAYYFQAGRGRRILLGKPPLMTLAQARMAAASAAGRSADGVDVVAEVRNERVTLGDFIEGDWWKYAEDRIASADRIKVVLLHSFADLLGHPMAQIGKPELEQWRKNRNHRTKTDGAPRKPVALETMRRELTYLRAVVNYGVASGTISTHKVGDFLLTATLADKHTDQKLRWLTIEEEARLRQALEAREQTVRAYQATVNAARQRRGLEPPPTPHPDAYADHIKPLVLLAMLTGLRRGDLFDLQWDQVDLNLGQIRRVIGKTSHARRKRGKPVTLTTLPLAPEALQILKTLRDHKGTSHLVFPSPVSGTRLDNIANAWEHLMRDASIERFRFHDLRHTFASRLVQAGVDLNTVRELMTHTDIKMTLVYAHLSPDHKAAALAKTFPLNMTAE
jgi:integrase